MFSASTSARPDSITFAMIRTSCSLNSSLASISTIATSDRSIADWVLRLAYHSGPDAPLTRRLIPAVSTKRQSVPEMSTISSTGSTVVPATESTTDRSSPARRFNRLDLPTFGRPSNATRRGPCCDSLPEPTSGNRFTISSSRSPLPRPCRAETVNGSPTPNDHSAAASSSSAALSTLLATRSTGTFARRSISTASVSASVAPTVVSTTSTTMSASIAARRACSLTCEARPLLRKSQPPVSMIENLRPDHSASYRTRSRVTPGMSSTTAARRPMIRLTSVDLPTFGRPTIATTGTATSSSAPRSSTTSKSPNSARAAASAAASSSVSASTSKTSNSTSVLASNSSLPTASPSISSDIRGSLLFDRSVHHRVIRSRSGQYKRQRGQQGAA